jgi:hypothetical protein
MSYLWKENKKIQVQNLHTIDTLEDGSFYKIMVKIQYTNIKQNFTFVYKGSYSFWYFASSAARSSKNFASISSCSPYVIREERLVKSMLKDHSERV